jgi:GNAT superfamily N-acetyltransferase
MDIEIREAVAADAPFLAWVMITAARSHRPLCFWDYAFPGPESPRLEYVAAMAVAEPISFAHFSGFIIAEHDGRPVAGLSGYDSAVKGLDRFQAALGGLLIRREWSAEHLALLSARVAPVNTCMPDSPPGVWVIEWVAALPEVRGRGVAGALLREILERGRRAGHERAQISYLIGNTPAETAYRRVGFDVVDERRHADFETAFGSPGIARMQRDL